MTEWRPVIGFEGWYEVNASGDLRSVMRSVPHGSALKTLRGKMIKPFATPTGHLTVSLYKHHRRYHRAVHRLVLESFVGPCPDGMECCHRDGNSANNSVENLYWGTRADNMLDAVRHGTHVFAGRDRCKRGHPYVPGSYSLRRNGARKCLICNRILQARYKERLRERVA